MILLQHRKYPEGLPKGVRPEVPPKPDILKRRVTIQEECKYLEPVKSHVCKKPEEYEPAYDESYEPLYELVGGMEDPEWKRYYYKY